MAQMLYLGTGQRKFRRVKETYAHLDEGDKEKQVKRRHRLCADLRCNLIKTEHPCEHHD